jgi:hypothetical protein
VESADLSSTPYLSLVSSTVFADSFSAELQQVLNRLREVNSIGLCVTGDRRRQVHDFVEQRGSTIFLLEAV